MASPEIALLLELVLDLKKDLSDIKSKTDKNTIILEEHARRSTASEERLERLEKKDIMLTGFVKIAAVVLGVVASVAGIIQVIHHF